MSTTGGSEQGTVYVLDEPEAIEKKFKSAVTDSGSEIADAPEKPGVSNLIEILAAVARGHPAAVEAELRGARGYGDFKTAVAEAVVEIPGARARALQRAAQRRGRPRGRSWPTAPSAPARSPPTRSPTCASAMGVGAAGVGGRPRQPVR